MGGDLGVGAQRFTRLIPLADMREPSSTETPPVTAGVQFLGMPKPHKP
jgi:hypothetical protein